MVSQRPLPALYENTGRGAGFTSPLQFVGCADRVSAAAIPRGPRAAPGQRCRLASRVRPPQASGFSPAGVVPVRMAPGQGSVRPVRTGLAVVGRSSSRRFAAVCQRCARWLYFSPVSLTRPTPEIIHAQYRAGIPLPMSSGPENAQGPRVRPHRASWGVRTSAIAAAPACPGLWPGPCPCPRGYP